MQDDGETCYVTELHADTVEFLDGRRAEAASAGLDNDSFAP